MSASAATRRAARFSSKSRRSDCSGSRTAHDPALALGGKRQAGADVLASELRKVREVARHFGGVARSRISAITA
jgi:hypothetical protein